MATLIIHRLRYSWKPEAPVTFNLLWLLIQLIPLLVILFGFSACAFLLTMRWLGG